MTRTHRLNKKLLLTLSLGLLGVAGAATILYSTRWGIGLNQDGLFYIGGAESILRGDGFSYMQVGESRTITKWPPGYSLLLSLFGLVAPSVSEGARWANAMLFGINIVLVGIIVMTKTARLWPALLASLLMLTSSTMLGYHVMALSEPLYFSLLLAALYFLDKYIQTDAIYPLVLSALFVSAATLTRFIGVTLIASLCISILIFSKRSLRQRLIDSVLTGLACSLPLLLWMVRNWEISRHETPLASGAEIAKMKIKTHLIELRHVKTALYAISEWVLPPPLPMSLQVAALVIVLLGTAFMVIRSRHTASITFVYLVLTHVVVYCLSHVFFISFVSGDIYYDSRYLLPVFLSIILIITICLGQISFKAKPFARIVVIVLCVLLPLSFIKRSASLVSKAHQHGLGLANTVWTRSAIMNQIKTLPNDVRVYSNLPIIVIYLTRRQVNALPYKIDPNTEEPFGDYLQKLKEIGTTSQNQRTLIFYIPVRIGAFPSEEELQLTLPLKKIATGPEGSLYEVLP